MKSEQNILIKKEKWKCMGEILHNIAGICSTVTVIATTIVLFVKPLREKVLGIKEIKEGLKCLLRAEMLRVYYKNRTEDKIRQYEYENFVFCYKAYKKLKGNSFIDHIKNEVDKWEVLT
jgi:hypothetical protein